MSGVPETVLRDTATLMLSYSDFVKTKRPNGRFKAIIKARNKFWNQFTDTKFKRKRHGRSKSHS